MPRNRFMRTAVSIVPALIAALLVACASDDDADPTAEPTETATSEASAGLLISDAWARATPGNPDENSAVYMMITNNGDADDRLVSAEIDDQLATTVELHETTMEDGQMRMRRVEGWDVPANGGELELAQGANHVMLIGLTKQLTVGELVGLTLHFEQAGEVHIEAPVREGMPMNMDMDADDDN